MNSTYTYLVCPSGPMMFIQYIGFERAAWYLRNSLIWPGFQRKYLSIIIGKCWMSKIDTHEHDI